MITRTVKTNARREMIDVTELARAAVREADLGDGLIVVYVPHTTAGVTINENADPDVVKDLLMQLALLAPPDGDYRHAEGNSDAHLKSSLFGCTQQILIEGGRLVLGTWQGVYFCEFDGPRTRKLVVRVARFA